MSTTMTTDPSPTSANASDTSPTDDVTAAAAALRALAAAEGGEVLAGQLSRLVAVIANEAVRTKRFRTDLLAALVPAPATGAAAGAAASEATDPDPTGSRDRLARMTKAQLKKLIDGEGMDPDATIKSRTTKDEMIDLVLAFRESRASDAAESPAADSPAAVPPANPPKRRRRPSTLDPYAVAADEGVDGLRTRLAGLDVEELKDVIAEYGMNHDGRAMGWHDHHRFVERIIEKTDFGATQGNAFR